MTGAFPTTDLLLIFTISGITNPSYENNWSVIVYTADATGTLIEQSGVTNFNYRTSPGPLTCAIRNLGSDVVAEYTDIAVDYTVTNTVELGGYFELDMSKWNSGT